MYIISGTIFIVSGIWILILDRHLNGHGFFNTNIFYDYYLAIAGIICILLGIFFYDIQYSKLRKSKKIKK